jgi:hypothetical protein
MSQVQGDQTRAVDLFEPGERSTLEPAEHGESNWSYLDRSGRPEWIRAREQLTGWFSRLCPSMRDGVRNRLRSGDDNEFAAAQWELYLHELFLRLGYEVQCEASVPNGRNIDFLVTRNGQSMYVEATVARSSAEALAADARRNRLYRALESVQTTAFMLDIEIRQAGSDDMPGARRLKRLLEDWLAGLDPDEVSTMYERTKGLPDFDWTAQNWVLHFEALPIKQELRGEVVSRPLGMFADETGGAIDDETRLHRALKRKAPSGYGELELPFVVAIAEYGWEISDPMWHRTNVMYGHSAMEYGHGRTPRSIRRPDGHWRGPGGSPRNSRLAAVMFASRLHHWQLDRAEIEWWDNPFAARPVDDALVPQVARRQQLVVSDGEGSLVSTEPALATDSLFAAG